MFFLLSLKIFKIIKMIVAPCKFLKKYCIFTVSVHLLNRQDLFDQTLSNLDPMILIRTPLIKMTKTYEDQLDIQVIRHQLIQKIPKITLIIIRIPDPIPVLRNIFHLLLGIRLISRIFLLIITAMVLGGLLDRHHLLILMSLRMK